MKIRTTMWAWAILSAAPLLAGSPAKLALQGGRIIPVVGAEIAKGTVLIEHGKITAVGENVEIPYDAMVVDVTGKVVFPGMIDAHSSRGMDVPNENAPVTPFLNVYDSIDPSQLYYEDALRDGVTSIHITHGHNTVIGGMSRVVHPIGLTPDEMTQAANVALKISIAPKRRSDRMVQIATLRETFYELADYLEELAEKKYEESLEEKDEEIDVGPDEARKRGKELIKFEDYDDKHANLVKLTRGELAAFVYCEMAGDVGRAIEIAKENGFFDSLVFVLGTHCYKAIDELKEAKRPIVLGPELIHRERDSVTGELTETFVPKVFADARLSFSILPSPSSSMAERYLNYQAARCVRNGVRRSRALKAITLYPAKAIGMGDKLGTLEVGKLANVLVLSGDPLDFNTWVEQVYVKGIKAYERSEDVRLKQLFGDEPEEVAEEPTDTGDKKADEPAGDPDAAPKGEGETGAPKDASKDTKETESGG